MSDSEPDDIPSLVNIAPSATIERQRRRIPVTIVTGYLGSGKSTLINKLLTEEHGKRIAVILNEFGESTGIDKSMSTKSSDGLVQEWLELRNGCLSKDPGTAAIENLIKQSGDKFDYIVIETTGLADPGPIASSFWLDNDLGSDLVLDGVLTLVDALNGQRFLNEIREGSVINEFTRQIALADRIVLNKLDLVSEDILADLEWQIRGINSSADILKTSHSVVPFGFYLDQNCFEGDRRVEVDESYKHDTGKVQTVCIVVKRDVRSDRLDSWLQMNVEALNAMISHTFDLAQALIKPVEPGFLVMRLKALVSLKDVAEKIVVQGVYDLFDRHVGGVWEAGEERESRVVLIGEGLDERLLRESFEAWCLVDEE